MVAKTDDTTPSTDLVAIEDYALVTQAAELQAVIRENLGNAGMRVFDLDRVHIPTGGGKTWSIPTLAGDEDARAIEGIIVAWRDPRAFWSLPLEQSEGNTPPDCSSDDGITGRGEYGVGSESHPTGECATCPMAQFGSKGDVRGDTSKGQACRQMRLLFMLRPDDMLPLAVFLAPTSVGPMRKYFLRLSGKGIRYYAVVTRLELEQTKNAANIAYSIVKPTVAGVLAHPDVERVKAYADAIGGALGTVTLSPSEFREATE